jgi:hypothetical protein
MVFSQSEEAISHFSQPSTTDFLTLLRARVTGRALLGEDPVAFDLGRPLDAEDYTAGRPLFAGHHRMLDAQDSRK